MSDDIAELVKRCLEHGIAMPQRTPEEWAAHETAEKAEAERYERQERIRLRREAVRGVPLRADDLRAIVLGELRSSPALEHVRKWQATADARPWLLLCGGIGVGKTIAAVSAMADSRDAVFCRAQDLARRLDPWKGERSDDRITTHARMFVLDDLGAERDVSDPRFAAALFQLVDERQSRQTVVTSNLPRAAFRDRYDPRVVDRLNACGRAIDIRGESMRSGGGGL